MGTEHWGNHIDYLVVLLGYGVGVGTLWKYPYLCVRNGGGAFLIPFIIFSMIGTIPVVFLEMTIGQFSQSGPVNVWNLCPPFKGLGIGTVVMTGIFSSYYSILMAWFIYYIYNSFAASLPWTRCDNTWNTPSCIAQGYNNSHDSTSLLQSYLNATKSESTNATIGLSSAGLTSAEEFWRYQTLQLSGDITEVGTVRWPIAVCSAILYLSIFFCLFKGVKVSGKVVYVTVIVPYILLVVFLIRACLLPGSITGILYYLLPDYTKLLDPKIWIEACNYALYSLGIAAGSIPTLAGHNKFTNNCTRDTLIFVFADMLTTVFAGFSFFAVIGHVAHLRNVPISAFESSGFNLGFIVYPEVIATLPFPQLWSVLTFITFLTLGFDSLVPCFEVIVMAVCDVFPNLVNRRCLIITCVLLTSYLIGMVYITQGGMYILTHVEWFCFFPSLSIFAMFECIVVGWCYGTERLNADIEMMWGRSMPLVLAFVLRYIEPLLMMVVFFYATYSFRPPKYGDFIYPTWATGIGWLVSLSSITPVVVVFLWHLTRAKGSSLKQKLKNALRPSPRWGPLDDTLTIEEDVTIAMIEK